MKIETIASSIYVVPMAEVWEDQTHRLTVGEIVLTQITSDTGLVGTGFASAPGMVGRASEATLHGPLAPLILGAEVAPRVLWHRMWSLAHDAGGGGITTLAI